MGSTPLLGIVQRHQWRHVIHLHNHWIRFEHERLVLHSLFSCCKTYIFGILVSRPSKRFNCTDGDARVYRTFNHVKFGLNRFLFAEI
ncbi:hypothetical protein ACSBR2_015165 [Camellia fascicularis]